MGLDEHIDIALKDKLYRMIVSQLFYDGYQALAVSLSNQVKAHPACPPSDRLAHIVVSGLKIEEEEEEKQKDAGEVVRGIDLEYENQVENMAAEVSLYETVYVTAHKAPCRTAVFDRAGKFIATGSEDASIKILSVDRIIAKSVASSDLMSAKSSESMSDFHPVVRTMYDHAAEVTSLDIHPFQPIVISGSKDFTVKFFDMGKPAVKKAYKSIQEAAEVRCLQLHPSGDYLLVGTKNPIVRLYDSNTCQCFVSSIEKDSHKGPITSVNWSQNGNMFVTSSKDGDLKVWDGVSNKCIASFNKAHDGHEVCSAVFSKNSKYVLSSGKDSLVRLWELSTSRCLIAYTGAGSTGKMEHRTNAVFNHTEDYVIFPDEKTTSLCCWDARNADRQRLLSLGHNNIVKCLVHSPTQAAMVSCSDDFRARFWYLKQETT